jgi:hypothetical protein
MLLKKLREAVKVNVKLSPPFKHQSMATYAGMQVQLHTNSTFTPGGRSG